MLKRIAVSMQSETMAERSQRMLPGALYGGFAALAYTLTLSLINPLTFPGLHIGVDWPRFLLYTLGFGLAMAFAGAIVGWFTEAYMGIIGGGVIIMLSLLIGSLAVSLLNGSGVGFAAISVVTSISLIGAAVLLAAGLRAAINRQMVIREEKEASTRRKHVAELIGLIFLVAFLPGASSRYAGPNLDILQAMNANLQAAKTDADARAHLPLDKVLQLENHLGMDYRLYPRASSGSAGNLDLTTRFQDGYTFTCSVSQPSGATVYFTDCNEGKTFNSPQK